MSKSYGRFHRRRVEVTVLEPRSSGAGWQTATGSTIAFDGRIATNDVDGTIITSGTAARELTPGRWAISVSKIYSGVLYARERIVEIYPVNRNNSRPIVLQIVVKASNVETA